MAKGQHYSRFQKGVIRRFYHYRDGQLVQRLQELVSELALDPTCDRTWKKVGDALGKLELEPPLPQSRVDLVMSSRDVEALAALVGTLTGR